MSMLTNSCPCCGGSLLRHVRHGELYWVCQTCRQEASVLLVTVLSAMDKTTKEIVAEKTVTS